MTSSIACEASAINGTRFHAFDKAGCTYKKAYLYKKSGITRKVIVTCPNEKQTNAYILNGRVRTHFQTLLIWSMSKKVRGIEVLEFNEPGQYRAPSNWYEKLIGQGQKGLFEVDALSGATLTRESTLNLVKEALHLDEILASSEKN